jgi:hypothetical protein
MVNAIVGCTHYDLQDHEMFTAMLNFEPVKPLKPKLDFIIRFFHMRWNTIVSILF